MINYSYKTSTNWWTLIVDNNGTYQITNNTIEYENYQPK